jgi:hypothetical protein
LTEVWDEQFADRATADDVLGLEEPEPETISEEVVSLLDGHRLYREDNLFGRSVRLRTLRAGEELECGLLVARYSGTPEEGRAYITAIVGAAVDTVDGLPIVEDLGVMNEDERVKKQFDYVRKTWYWSQIQRIYEQIYLPLLDDFNKALEELRLK